ncbi:TetR/AcrR family transcriptional regulator [Novosphingobium album (ex Liu et al. 2023)]|uniref:TetR/AcrR family transcriptional regulator n=1 Tax=Novosphingobium album (ex Liu et al. 2023) TaxID=3031130 RepID=A0ABT5WLP0_9SPHN|nr:TetR/AcrR family transcriptional regulator [Novosphingobium album (ex Liu et al. 2023)]MDE8650940.1 TetR/AcrR family transcriptional regulator [Novosphingobium album (ex Liu et al. 2023)]
MRTSSLAEPGVPGPDSDPDGDSPQAGPARRRPGRPTLSNEQLLDKALDLFLEKGFDGTSIDAITAAAGMAKRTVYARYGDKTTLFKAALGRAIEEWIVPIDRLRAEETDDFEQTLLRIGAILVANVLSPAGLRLLRLTNAESVRMPEISIANVQLGTGPTLAYLADLFRRRLGGPDGVMADADEAATAFLNIVVGGQASNAAWGMPMDPQATDRHIRYSVRILLHGLLDREAVERGADDQRLRRLLDETMVQLDEARARLTQAARLARE